MTTRSRLAWLPPDCPVIGMVHCRSLPGSPRFEGSWQQVLDAAVADATALVDSGVPALLLENFGDAPFYPRRVPPATIAQLTRIATELSSRFDVPLGINVLRNDGLAAIAIAAAVGARFVRVNVLSGARVTDQGLLEGRAHEVLRSRRMLGESAAVNAIDILADVAVKHSAALAARPLADEATELVERGGADAVIATGDATGQPTDLEQLRHVREAVSDLPVVVGSGVSAANVAACLAAADAVIVGSSLKHDGDPRQPVDLRRVQEFLAAVKVSRR